jgi:hypothetical protein
MLKVKDHLDEKNIPFYAIDFRLWYSENYREKYASKDIDVLNFYYKDIEEKGLEKRIKRRMEANK